MLVRETVRIWKALGYSLAGLRAGFSEPAFQTEVLLAIILIPLALWIPVDVVCKAFLVESMVLILVVELINVGLEDAINYISTERHPLAKKVKDVASASVFICLINAFAMWVWAVSQIVR